MYDPNIGKITVVAESAKGTAHPPVISRESLKPGQGILPAGLLLMASPSGHVPFVKGSGEVTIRATLNFEEHNPPIIKTEKRVVGQTLEEQKNKADEEKKKNAPPDNPSKVLKVEVN